MRGFWSTVLATQNAYDSLHAFQNSFQNRMENSSFKDRFPNTKTRNARLTGGGPWTQQQKTMDYGSMHYGPWTNDHVPLIVWPKSKLTPRLREVGHKENKNKNLLLSTDFWGCGPEAPKRSLFGAKWAPSGPNLQPFSAKPPPY